MPDRDEGPYSYRLDVVEHLWRHGVQRRLDPDDVPRPRERLRERRRRVDGPSDDGLDDLRELRRMRRGEKDPHVPHPPYLPHPPLQPHVRDGGMRIQYVATLLVDLPDRPSHRAGGSPAVARAHHGS